MNSAQQTLDLGEPSGSAPIDPLAPRMTMEQLVQNRAAIQRQAKGLFSAPGAFPDEPDAEKRMNLCIRVVAEIWMLLGPQKDDVPNAACQTPASQEKRHE